jgi:hypothetical protein
MTPLRAGLFLASLLLLSAPSAARAEDTAARPPAAKADDPCERGDVAPLGYRCALPRAFTGLMVSGGLAVGLGYTITAFTMLGNQSVDRIAALPVFGAFIAAGTHRVTPTQTGDWFPSRDDSVPFYLVSGVMQVAGVVLMLGTLEVRHPVLRPSKRKVSLTPVPLAFARGSGLGLTGTF